MVSVTLVTTPYLLLVKADNLSVTMSCSVRLLGAWSTDRIFS